MSEKSISRSTRCAIYPRVSYFKKSASRCRIKTVDGCKINRAISRSNWNEWLMQLGYKPIGSGAFRRGFSFKDNQCVLKVEKGRDPWNNRQEIGDYVKAQTHPDFKSIRPFIVPIVTHAHNHKWMIVPKARTVLTDHLSESEYRKVQRALKERFDKAHVCCSDVLGHDDNMGQLEGKPVVVDYGFGFKCTLPSKSGSCPRGTSTSWGTKMTRSAD